MSREIKFRAWDKNENKIYQDYDMSKYGFAIQNSSSATLNNIILMLGSNNIELMQYTGLKDKNGVEIYEGDIVEYGSDHFPLVKRIVVWNQQYCCYKTSNSKNRTATSPQLTADKVFKTNMRVIGNIYETPELLKQT